MALPKVLANFTTSLATKISSTASSLTLSRSTDPDGTTLSGQYILTVDEGTSVEEHMLVTLAGSAGTIDTRGLSKVDMTTSKTANKFAHDRGAETKITNAVLIKTVNRLNGTEAFDSVALTGVASIAGLSTPTSGETTKAANVAYVNGVAIAGAPDATTSVKGIIELATAAELAAGTATGSTGASLVAAGTNFNATSSAAVLVPVTNSSGKLAAGFGGSASSLATLNGSSLVVENPANATATPTASKIPIADGSGYLTSWVTTLQRNVLLYKSLTPVTVTNTVTETTLFSTTISAGVLSSTNGLNIQMLVSALVAASHNITLRLKYGGTTISTMTITIANTFSTVQAGWYTAQIFANAATNAQKGYALLGVVTTNSEGTALRQITGYGAGSASVDSTSNQTLSITAEWATNSVNDSITAEMISISKLEQA